MNNSYSNIAGNAPRLEPVKSIPKLQGYRWTTESYLRHAIFEAEPRVGSGGTEIPGNGLAPAIIRIGRKILIDLDAFDEWVEAHRMGRS